MGTSARTTHISDPIYRSLSTEIIKCHLLNKTFHPHAVQMECVNIILFQRICDIVWNRRTDFSRSCGIMEDGNLLAKRGSFAVEPYQPAELRMSV